MSENLTIVNIIDMLLKRWGLIVITAILAGVLSFVYSEVFIEPVYRSTASLYVNSTKNVTTSDISSSTINSSRQLVATYAEILKARTFLTNISEDLYGKYTTTQIKNMISMKSLSDTEILSISVDGTNPEDVYQITKSLIKYAPDELIRVVEAGSVKVLDDASEPKSPISPDIRKNTFIGVFFGLIFGSIIVILLDLFDTRIKSEAEITQRYKEPLLGEIPSLANNQSYSYNYEYQNSNKGGGNK